MKVTDGFLHFIRKYRHIGDSQSDVERRIVHAWSTCYKDILQSGEIIDNRIDMLKQAAISVKYELEDTFRFNENDYDINCACVLYEPFQLHIDITPKHKRCTPIIASIYLH